MAMKDKLQRETKGIMEIKAMQERKEKVLKDKEMKEKGLTYLAKACDYPVLCKYALMQFITNIGFLVQLYNYMTYCIA